MFAKRIFLSSISILLLIFFGIADPLKKDSSQEGGRKQKEL